MPKLPILKPKVLVKKLEKLGFVIDHHTGSHIIMYRRADGKRAVVPVHTNELPKGTLLSILRESGISRDEL